jgi:hypothetical protein
MASIIGDKPKYRNATDVNSGGWAVTDKIFGYLDKLGDIYKEVRYPPKTNVQPQNTVDEGIFGLPKPIGTLLIIAGSGLLVYIVYKVATKE